MPIKIGVYLKAALAVAALCAWTPTLAQEGVSWKVQDRFRLFDQAEPEARQRIETLLDDLHAAKDDTASGVLRGRYEQIRQTLTGKQAASLRRSNWLWSRTVKDKGARRYRQGYFYPEHYTILAKLTDPTLAGLCLWRVGVAEPVAAACDQSVNLNVSAGAQASGWGANVDAEVTRPDGLSTRFPIVIRDRLIVAMGDSFISGEGNPDQPAVIPKDLPADARFRRVDWLGSAAAKTVVAPAEWWDEPCHRSLLSWPVLASLLEASRDEHAALTLAHLGCSGAEGPLGLYAAQTKLPGGGDERTSQAQALEALLKQSATPRRIDRLFLSIGGNDIGFARVIAYLFIPPNGYGLGPLDVAPAMASGLFGGAVRPYDKDALPLWALGRFSRSSEQRLRELPARLDRVEQTLSGLGVARSAIFQAGYPDIFHDDRGELCRTILDPQRDLAPLYRTDPEQAKREEAYGEGKQDDIRGGFEATLYTLPPFVKLRRDWNFQVQFTPDQGSTAQEPCTPIALPGDSEVCKTYWVWANLNRAVSASAGAKGWTFIDSHIKGTSGHGWCVSPKDSLRMPVAKWDGNAWRWDPAAPGDFDPYRQDLGRWFRTANDSARSQWASPKRMHQGTVHPTFNMHIAYAEAVFDAAFPIE